MELGFHRNRLVIESVWSNPRSFNAVFLIENVFDGWRRVLNMTGKSAHLITVLADRLTIQVQAPRDRRQARPMQVQNHEQLPSCEHVASRRALTADAGSIVPNLNGWGITLPLQGNIAPSSTLIPDRPRSPAAAPHPGRAAAPGRSCSGYALEAPAGDRFLILFVARFSS